MLMYNCKFSGEFLGFVRVNELAIQNHIPAAGLMVIGHDAKKCRLAASIRADNRGDFPDLDAAAHGFQMIVFLS